MPSLSLTGYTHNKKSDFPERKDDSHARTTGSTQSRTGRHKGNVQPAWRAAGESERRLYLERPAGMSFLYGGEPNWSCHRWRQPYQCRVSNGTRKLPARRAPCGGVIPLRITRVRILVSRSRYAACEWRLRAAPLVTPRGLSAGLSACKLPNGIRVFAAVARLTAIAIQSRSKPLSSLENGDRRFMSSKVSPGWQCS